jgi:hypothetical protein
MSTMNNVTDGHESDNNSEEVESKDTVAPLCTCGQSHLFTGDDGSSSLGGRHNQHPNNNKLNKLSSTSNPPSWLESSFVHLLTPRRTITSSTLHSSVLRHGGHASSQLRHQHGFLESHQLLQQLLNVATLSSSSESLCMECMDRVATALESDTNRLYLETQAYHDSIQASKQQAATFHHLLSPTMDLEHTELAYRNEIDMLTQEVEASESELANLASLFEEQLAISRQLDALDEELQQEQNALQLQSRSFDNSMQLKTTELYKVQTEVDRLFLVKLPQALFDLQVDERGLRYPLINQLRLAYRPKGDVPPKEIQVAWSQATQLLLILGTLLQYPSSDWKLVPLAEGAKLIYRKEIFNLSPGDCRSLMAWNALLDQVVKHTIASGPEGSSGGATTWNKNSNNNNANVFGQAFQSPPFVSSPSSIGSTDLIQLDRNDHVGWSQVIHRMASNLLWLSDCVSDRVATQVGAITHCIA